jgi:hypothetical protein
VLTIPMAADCARYDTLLQARPMERNDLLAMVLDLHLTGTRTAILLFDSNWL